MNKRLLSMILTSLLILAFAIPAQASTPTVVLDGKTMTFDVPPVMENGSVLVPMRAIFEAQGATVVWDNASETVTATKGNTIIKLVIDGKAFVNGKEVVIGIPSKLVNDRTMVPLRLVSESLGADVKWDNAIATATITSKSETPAAPAAPKTPAAPSTPETPAAPSTPKTPVAQLTPFEKYLNTLPCDPAALVGCNEEIEFVITGTDEGKYDVVLKDGKVTWTKGSAAKPDATITTEEQKWLDIASGKESVVDAFMNGEFSVLGSLDTVTSLANVFVKSNQ